MRRARPPIRLVSTGLGLAGPRLSAPSPALPADCASPSLRWPFVGAPLMEVRTPASRIEIAVGAVDLLVSFVGGPRVAVETFQCLLNDRDVTAALTLGRNGAAAR